MKVIKNGFSLFELLVVMSIIGILTAVVSVAYSGAQRKARDARRVEDMKAIQTAAEQYYSQNSYIYPSSSGVGWTGKDGSSILEVFPIDPKDDSTNGYVYTYTVGTTYCACAKVENILNGNATNTVCSFSTVSTGNTGPYFCVKSQQ